MLRPPTPLPKYEVSAHSADSQEAENRKLACRRSLQLGRKAKYERWSGAELEGKVRQARGKEVLAALYSLQSQRVNGRCYPPGNALWYYISLLYFGERSTNPRALPVSAPSQDLIMQQLLRDLGTESLDDIQTRCERELKELQASVSQLLPSISPKFPCMSTPEKRILEFTKNTEFTRERKSYLQYEERRVLEKIPADCCAVCGGGESLPPDNWIVLCSGCDVAVHMRCFGINILPENDWFCDVCRLKPELPVCGLCLQSGGILKATIHDRDWPSIGTSKQKLWAHLYCAQLLGSSFLLPESKDLLNLSSLCATAWTQTCELCKRLEGACVSCKACEVAFHPECWRQAHPTLPFAKSSLLCRRHYPRISIATVEMGESCLIHEIFTFSRYIAKRKGELAVPISNAEFTVEENRALIERMESYLESVNSMHNFGFSITIHRTTGAVKTERPEAFNAVAPDALQYVEWNLPGRSQEQCLQQYQVIYPLLMRRLRRPRVELSASAQLYQVVKKRRLVKRHCEPLEAMVRLPLVAPGKDLSSSSTQDLSEDEIETTSYT